jgi:two-component system, chemotaxis family, chemotaxis protein CheY
MWIRNPVVNCGHNYISMKILVVDDENDVKVLFEQRFRKEIRSGELEFLFAFSGEDALSCLDQYSSEPFLVLSDINMPGMSGLDLLKKIRQADIPQPPQVVMISAYGDAENYNCAMKSGANDFLTKPVDFTLLKEKLKELAA